jgi:Ca-activated chloride channel homolog
VTLASPVWLLSLLVIPAAILLYRLAERRRMRYAVAFTNLSVLASVAGRGRSWRRLLPAGLFLLALAALCVALARPHRTTTVAKNRSTVILVIDVSGSMQATDVAPTRLGAAQQAVREFVKLVPKQVKLGLIAFAGEADVAATPSTNRDDFLASLDAIGTYSGYGGTAIGDALAAAVDLGRASVQSPLAAVTKPSPTRGLVSILFLSDGAQNRGLLLPLQGAQKAKQAGIPVYTVALGTPHGTLPAAPGGFGSGGYFGNGQRRPVPPDPATLHAIASATGGEFVDAQRASTLQAAYKRLGSKLGRTRSSTEVTSEFLGLGALLLIAAGVLSVAWSPRIP